MERLMHKLFYAALGASGAGFFSLARCGGGGCASCMGCAGAGIGIALWALFGKLTGGDGKDGMA
ncbi:MAG: hypothetical protein Q8J64_08550 [Thermodesulfovibrionales bacterium]|nr:hypothetical protein [Thermodesulfovibrionales bacterium]